MKRIPTAALAALLLAGCTDVGLDGNIPLEEAMQGAPSELVAQVHRHPAGGEDDMIIDGRLWVPWGLPAPMEAGALRPVGSTRGTTVHARSWDRSPYDDLFARDDAGEWQRYAPVIGGAGVPGVPAAAH